MDNKSNDLYYYQALLSDAEFIDDKEKIKKYRKIVLELESEI